MRTALRLPLFLAVANYNEVNYESWTHWVREHG